eukprot:tig00000903_g5522.t1
MCDCEHEASCATCEELLNRYVDTTKVRCLNESVAGSCQKLFKTLAKKSDRSSFLESAADEQLMLHIPFTGAIKLKSICVIGEGSSAPSKVKLYVNRADLDFGLAEQVPAAQEVELQADPQGAIEYPLKIAKFQNVTDLTMFFSENFGADSTRIYYIGLKGSYTKMERRAVSAVYELRPQVADHKNKAENALGRQIQ